MAEGRARDLVGAQLPLAALPELRDLYPNGAGTLTVTIVAERALRKLMGGAAR